MTKLNEFNKVLKAMITIILYFFWPTFALFILKLIGIEAIGQNILLFNFLLLVIVFFIYFKDICMSLKDLSKNSLQNILLLLLTLIIVQVATNFLSVALIGINNHYYNIGMLSSYLDKWPFLMNITMIIYYPIVETLVFSKALKDIVNGKWAFIVCSSLFFWLVNLLAFDFTSASIIATMSCFTTSIVINYFYSKFDNISQIFIVKMIYNLIFLLLP